MSASAKGAASVPEILVTRRTNLKRLQTLLRLVEGSWALAICESPTVRQVVLNELQQALPALTIVQVALVGQTPDPLAILRRLDVPTAPTLVAFYAYGEGLLALCRYLDIQREALARLPHHLLFWVSQTEYQSFLEHAPNFTSRLNGIFEFPGLAPMSASPATTRPEPDRQQLTFASDTIPPIRHYNLAHLRAQIAYYQRRVAGLCNHPRPDLAVLGEDLVTLANLYTQDEPRRWAEAENAYSEAANVYTQAGLILQAAAAHYQAGNEAWRVYATASALAHLQQAQALYQQLVTVNPQHGPAHLGEASVFKVQGDVLYFLKQMDEARLRYEQALELYRAVGDHLGEANVLKAQGDVLVFLDQRDEALMRFEEALDLYRAMGARLGEANVLKAQGDVLSFLKQTDEALARYEQALGLFRTVGARLGEANVLKAQGDVLSFLKRMDEALGCYEQALGLFRAVGDQLGEANVLQAQGDMFSFLKRMDEALGCYEQALGLFRAVGARLGEANVHKAQGDIFAFLDQHDEALVRYEQALDLYRTAGARLGEANVLAACAQVAAMTGEQQQTDHLLEQAIDLYRQIGDRYSVPAQIGNVGWTLWRANQKSRAQPYLQQAATLFAEMGLDDYAKRCQSAATATLTEADEQPMQ